MRIHKEVPMMEDLPHSFVDDGYSLTPEMLEKYNDTKLTMTVGQMRSREEMFSKNTSMFDVTGRKVVWGDIAPRDVADMKGVFYLLSEHRSYWKIPKDVVKGECVNEDPNSKSVCRDWLPDFEAVVVDIKYVKDNAFARIVDGEIQTSSHLLFKYN